MACGSISYLAFLPAGACTHASKVPRGRGSVVHVTSGDGTNGLGERFVVHACSQSSHFNFDGRQIDHSVSPSFTEYLLEHQKTLKLSDEELAYLAGSMYGAGSDTVRP